MTVPTCAPVRASVIESLDRLYWLAKRQHEGHTAAKMWAKLVAARRKPMPLANPEILRLAYAINDFITALGVKKSLRSKMACDLLAIVEPTS